MTIYCYPSYEMARREWQLAINFYEGHGIQCTYRMDNLSITVEDGEDLCYRYVPVRVNVDMERLAGIRGTVYYHHLEDELHRQVSEELAKLKALTEAWK